MATTSRKSASKKTKTSRKVSAATTRKSTSKKAPAKKRATKAAAPKTTAKTAATSRLETSTKVPKTTVKTTTAASEPMSKLRRLNMFVVLASAVQAGLILWLSKAFGGIRSVNVSFPTNDALATASSGKSQVVMATHRLFDVHLSWMIAAFLIVTALMHLLVATVMRKRYEREVGANVNRMRWMTFAVSGSLLLVTIALAAGLSDLSILLSIIGFTVVGSLVALSREHYTQNGERTRLVYSLGAIAAAAPWVMFLVTVLANHQYGSGGTPKYLYWVYFTGIVLVLAIARSLRMQTRAKGRWADYLFAERAYIWIALLGNAAITWQLYSALLKK